jgi:diguanylate cyclase (GGDEF)-like protein/PAS domain S-box-containing protein
MHHIMLNSHFYLDLLENLYDGVYYVDRRRSITYWNRAAEQITGFSREEVLGRKCSDNLLRHVNDRGDCLCLSACPLAETIADGAPRKAAVFLHHKNGHRVPVYVHVSPIRSKAGKIIGAVEVFNNNSETVAALQHLRELQDQAYTDPLTGIANRKYTEIFLEARFNELSRFGWPFGLVFADIDHFKRINDTYGHPVGDLVLKMVANTLAHNCRSFDLVGRWGGEEFLLVLSHMGEPQKLEPIAERLRLLVAHSYLGGDQGPIAVTLSMGATLAQPGDTIESLLQRVDQLLYQGKNAGRNRLILG